MTTQTSDVPPADGFRIGYAKGKGAFRVYISCVLSAVFAVVWITHGSEIALVLAVFFGATTYYFYPLIETEKVRLGAGEHGIFIEGFGVIPWRSVKDIRLSTYAIRSIDVSELHIELAKALPGALVADWRSLSWFRLLMKLPWSMRSDNVVRINLEPFSGKPDEIHRAIERNWRYFRQ